MEPTGGPPYGVIGVSREPGDPGVAIVGREIELASVRDPPLGEQNVRAVVLVGEPGIGKTGLSYREAAKALRTRESTITTRLHRGRQHIARALKGEPPATADAGRLAA